MTMRRGACPELARPMPTGDGLLARLHPAGAMPVAAFADLCAGAARFGNGVVEVTRRGSLQVRGLRPDTVAPFAAFVGALDFDAPDGLVVQAPPLSEESLSLAATIRQRLRDEGFAGRVAPKTAIVVDLGDGLSLDGLAADIRLRRQDGLLHLAAGDRPPAWLGTVHPDAAAEAVARLLAAQATAGPAERLRDLDPADRHAAVADLLKPPAAGPASAAADAIGRRVRAGGRFAIGYALAFGTAEAGALRSLALEAGEAGATGIWACPGRVLLFDGLASAAVDAFDRSARDRGLIAEEDDPRRRVDACTGAPGCASARQPVRDLALRVAEMLGPEDSAHLSGCPKGCAHPGAAPVTLVGLPGGFRLVRDGRADASGGEDMPAAEMLARLPEILEKRRRCPAVGPAAGPGAIVG